MTSTYDDLIKRIAKRFAKRYRSDYDDLYQEGVLRFLLIRGKAANIEDSFERLKYVSKSIRFKLERFVTHDCLIHTPRDNKKKEIIELSDPILSRLRDKPPPLDLIDERCLNNNSLQHNDVLRNIDYVIRTTGERQVVRELLCGYTIGEIANNWGTSPRNIRRILDGIKHRYANQL